jgi:hypothetical protein
MNKILAICHKYITELEEIASKNPLKEWKHNKKKLASAKETTVDDFYKDRQELKDKNEYYQPKGHLLGDSSDSSDNDSI